METPNWTYCGGGSGEKTAWRGYRDNALGVQSEVHTRRRANGEWMTGEITYYIDGDGREFTDEADMMTALEARQPGAVKCLCGRDVG